MKPKILFIMSSFTVGGAEKQWAQYLSLWPKDKCDVEIITFLPSESESVEISFKQMGIEISLIDRSSLSFFAFFKSLIRTIRQKRPTLVHTVLTGSVGTWGRLAAWLCRVPIIMHSDRALNGTATQTQKRIRPFLDRVTKRFLPNAKATADWLKSLGIPSQKIIVVPNVTNLERFDPTKVRSLRCDLGIAEDAIVAGFIAKFRPEKRLDLLLDALLLIPEAQRPDVLLLGGDGPVMPMVKERIAADAWLKEHCIFLGIVEDTPRFYATLDYSLLTSDHEGLPNVVLEALAMEKPVVATAVTDLPDLLEGVGFLAEPSKAQSVAEAILKVQALTKEERHALGKLGRKKILATYELSKAGKVFWDAHLELLGPELG